MRNAVFPCLIRSLCAVLPAILTSGTTEYSYGSKGQHFRVSFIEAAKQANLKGHGEIY